MKIIIGTESFRPNVSGVAIFAEDLANYLNKKGNEVFVVAPSLNRKTHWDQEKLFKILRVGAINNPLRSGNKITYRVLPRIENYIAEIKPDLIHIQDPAGIGTALLRYGEKRHIPVVATNHFSMDFVSAYIKFLGPLEKPIEQILSKRFADIYNRCDVVTTPSETALKKVKRWGVRREIKLLNNGVDIDRFKPGKKRVARKLLGLPDKPTVIYAGRVDVDKSVPVLLRAIPLVLKEIDANFIFVGSGKDIEKIKQMAEDLEIVKNTKFTGFLPNSSKKYPLTFQAADLFASASKIETQSIVMLEALASGLPVVAANAGSFPEFIENEKNGFLFAPDDSVEMAKCIRRILTDNKLQKTIGLCSREISLNYDKNKTLKRFLDLYKELTTRKNQR